MQSTEILILLLLAFVNSLVIIGWNKATEFDYERGVVNFAGDKPNIEEDSKMILWKLRYYAINKIGYFWSKPLFTCCTCMASVHSTYIYWAALPLDLHSLVVYPIYILGLAGMVTIINNHA
jgi:hypothetical protein